MFCLPCDCEVFMSRIRYPGLAVPHASMSSCVGVVICGTIREGWASQEAQPTPFASRLFAAPDPHQIPNSSFMVRDVEAIDCALARSSSLPFGLEKPWPVPL